MRKPHVVITGGAGGLGLGCAVRFRKRGFDVTIADIDADGARRAVQQLQGIAGTDDGRVRAEMVNLADPDSIAALAQRLLERGEAIDALVNNAGIYPPSQRTLTPEGHELTFAIAHLGHFRLTHALWPLLERAEAARVISVSSLVQRRARLDPDDLAFERGYTPILAYRQAKLACLLFALELQRRLDSGHSTVSSYAAHPGVCRTGIGRNRPRSERDNAWQRFSTAMLAGGLRHVGQSPETGAASVEMAATARDIPPGAFIGPRRLFESFGPPGLVQPGPAARDADLARQLWERSEALTGARWAY